MADQHALPRARWNAYTAWPDIVLRAFDAGVPFVKLDIPSGAIVLARRNKGEVIDDPDCDQVFVPLAAGVFRRCLVTTQGKPDSYRYLMACHADRDAIADAIGHELSSLSPQDMEAMALGVAWQSTHYQHANGKRR